ncbi:HAD domain-containing protein [Paucibacter sp. JuS9]|uniref:HAD domain-containing protein n=1 Tax=Paucibacter sp. JuS9 TaxID=3228748 RepID=UPI00375710C5
MHFYIFLDFDGVLHPAITRPEHRWASMYVLAEVLQRRPHARVVVSSSFREFTCVEAMQAIFPTDLQDRVVGATPMIPIGAGDVRLPGHHREVLAWLAGNGASDSSWLALDDDPDRYADGCRQLYLVDPNTGLTWADVVEICGRIPNLLDPTFESTDEQLNDLAERAWAAVARTDNTGPG